MLEIKNVTTRKINGVPKEDIDTNGMEVCHLNKCDFLETEIYESDYDDFVADGSFRKVLIINTKELYHNIIDANHTEYTPFQ